MTKVEFVRRNPTATYAEFFKATKGNRQTFYSIKYRLKQAKPSSEKPAQEPQSLAKKEKAENLRKEIESLQHKTEDLGKEIESLQHQIIGFRAVISYLEHLADIRGSQ